LFVFSAVDRDIWNQFISEMINGNNDQDFWERLAIKMSEYSDEEIISILRKHKLYEPKAQEIAIAEAIRRGIIHSEQDLFSENFRTEPSRFTLFPHPEKKETMLKIVRSMSRALLLAGVIPIVFGVLKFQVFKYAEGSALVFAGLIWITSAWLIFSRQEKKFLTPMLVIAILSAVYVARILFLLKGLKVMDYAVPSILFVVILYSLFYLRSLLRKLPDK
jgi:hypothetical protein